MEKNKKILLNILEWIVCFILAFILALLVKYYIGTFTTVKQSSMYPTLVENDKLWLNRLTRTFKVKYNRGDIITTEAPLNNKISINNMYPVARYKEINGLKEKFQYYIVENTKTSLIKRIIGLPNDHIQIKDGEIYINGKKYDEPYLKSDVKTSSEILTDFVVPEKTYFVLGDNRSKSSDSRNLGCISEDKIEGRVNYRFFPFSKFGKIDKK